MTFQPSPGQAEAIRAIKAWFRDPHAPQVFYLAGYAGTGKSTIYAEILRELGVKNAVTCAYTGKAANVLRRKGAPGAMTVHAAIYVPEEDEITGDVRFVKNDQGPAAEADLIGLDECSMIDDVMGGDLLSFGKKVLVTGDPGQLPPINGDGLFTKRRPDVFLTEVHRQAADSPIIRLATQARLGQRINFDDYGDDVRVLPLNRDNEDAVYREDSQTLCGVHRVRYTVTRRFRQRLGFGGTQPLKGERLICCRNDRKKGVFNGSMGTLLVWRGQAEGGSLRLTVDMEDLPKPLKVNARRELFEAHYDGDPRPPPYVRGLLEFDWAYVITVHKAQGSEWPHVTVIDDSGSFSADRTKWLYTAITRAAEGLTLLRRSA